MPTTLASFPADDPVWATDEVNNTAPITAKQELGWEVDEEPASAYFNWWQFYVWKFIEHYKAAIVQVNDAKVDRAGDAALSGDFIPTTDNVSDLGSSSKRWALIYVSGLTANNIVIASTGSIVPAVDGDADLGSASFRWALVYSVQSFAAIVSIFSGGEILPVVDGDANIGSTGFRFGEVWANEFNVTTSVLPAVAGAPTLGSNSLPWATIVGRTIRSDTASVFRRASVATAADLALKSALTETLAMLTQTSATSTANVGYNYNITTVARTSTGLYTVDFTVPIDEDRCVAIATAANILFGCCTVAVAVGGASCIVRVYNASGTLTDGEFHLHIVGDHLVADPVG